MKNGAEYLDALKAALPKSIDFGAIYSLVPAEEWEADSRGAALKAFIRADIFDSRYYLEKYDDIREAGLDPLWHYLNHGIFENRAIEPELGECIDEPGDEADPAAPPSPFDPDQEDSISVLIPAFNVEPYLERAVTSILNQSHKNLEIIIYDDASIDATRAVAERLASQFGNVVLLCGDENRGESYARNKCLAAARGKYVSFVDGDDYYIEDEFLKRMMETARRDRAEIVISPYRRIKADGEPVTDQCRDGLFSGREAAQIYIDRGFGSHGCAAKLFLTGLVKAIHVNEYGYSEDVPFVLEALLAARRVSVSHESGYMYDMTTVSSWRPPSPTPLHYYSSLRVLFEIIILGWEEGFDLKACLDTWQIDHGKRILEYIANPANLLPAIEISGYFSAFGAIIEQLVPELRHIFSLASKTGERETQFLSSPHKKYVHALQGRMQRFLDRLPVRPGKNYVIWAQHLKSGGLERVATQLGNSLAEEAQIYYLLEEQEYDFDARGKFVKADLLNPETYRTLRDATAIFDFHWKAPDGNYPLLNYTLSRYIHKYILTVHSSLQCEVYFDVPARILNEIGKTEAALQGILCVSDSVREEMNKQYGPLLGLNVVHNPLEIAQCERAEPVNKSYQYVLFAGRLDVARHKGIDLLIQAWRNSKFHNSGTKLLLAGAEELDLCLQEYLDVEKMRGEVEIIGFSDKIYSYMKGAIFTVVPSRWEGFGNVVIESLACGTPVLASKVGIAAEVIVDEKNGLLVEPGSLASLRQGLDTMKEIVPQINGADCKASVRQFDIRNYADKLKASVLRA